jgi:hypothetical protein
VSEISDSSETIDLNWEFPNFTLCKVDIISVAGKLKA